MLTVCCRMYEFCDHLHDVTNRSLTILLMIKGNSNTNYICLLASENQIGRAQKDQCLKEKNVKRKEKEDL